MLLSIFVKSCQYANQIICDGIYYNVDHKSESGVCCVMKELASTINTGQKNTIYPPD